VYKGTDTYCPPSESVAKCQPCIPANQIQNGRPDPAAFNKFLPMFLNSTDCQQLCAKCGTPHVANVVLDPNTNEVLVSRFRTYHSVLTTQADYINALKSSRRIVDEIATTNKIPLYAYSVFYVFFEQYLYIEGVAWMNVGLAMTAIMALCLVLLRNIWASGIICLTIAVTPCPGLPRPAPACPAALRARAVLCCAVLCCAVLCCAVLWLTRCAVCR
jgi:Niemann-Pick C1 protein